jgi:hypothetical protein
MVAWQGIVAGAPQVSMDQVRGVRGWDGNGCRAVARLRLQGWRWMPVGDGCRVE